MFGRKKKAASNLQDMQKEFNQLTYQLGDIQYRQHMIKQELSRLNSQANTLTQKMDNLGVKAQKTRNLMQQEVQKTIAKGTGNEPKLAAVADEGAKVE